MNWLKSISSWTYSLGPAASIYSLHSTDLNMWSVAVLISALTDIQYHASRDCRLMTLRARGSSQSSLFRNTVLIRIPVAPATENVTSPVWANLWASWSSTFRWSSCPSGIFSGWQLRPVIIDLAGLPFRWIFKLLTSCWEPFPWTARMHKPALGLASVIWLLWSCWLRW